MSTIDEDVYPIHEAGGLTSSHDVEIYRAWQKALPGYEWKHAVVDRYDGLTLYIDDEFSMGLHFAHALCGYGGSGPQATAQILHEAGFGELSEIRRRVSDGSSRQISLSR